MKKTARNASAKTRVRAKAGGGPREKQKSPFVALSECHLLNQGTMAEIAYYPDVQGWMQSMEPVLRNWAVRSPETPWPTPCAAELVKYMDLAGVDVAFVLREPAMNVSGYVASLSTNGFIMQEIEPYPDRLYLECNVGPILRRGVKHAIWELEYLVQERNAKLCKVYQPEDDGPLNDRRMWPFYEKACELNIPLTMHTGTAYVLPHPERNTRPILLDDILLDFPDLKIIAYHMGWPHTEELIGLAGKHKNLYLSLSGIVGWFARAPYRGYHALGQSLQWAGADKIVMGLDLPFDETKRIVDSIRNLEMPEELQEQWGYAPITDEIRAKILGLNLARVANIKPKKRV
jgi:uncharacterized protein